MKKIINAKLWERISSIEYNRPGNRYRFAAYDYGMCGSRIVLVVYDAGDNSADANVPERTMKVVDCLLWSIYEEDVKDDYWYWASFIVLLHALVEDNTAWRGHERSLRARAERGEILPDDYTPEIGKLPESEWTEALTDWVREIRESEDTVCVYDAYNNINRYALTTAARLAVDAYDMYWDGDDDDANEYPPEIGWMYYR